jgi:hypothetical protein
MMTHDERLAFVRQRIFDDVDWADDSFKDALPEAIVERWEHEIAGIVDEGDVIMVASHEQAGRLAAAVRLLDAERGHNEKLIDAALKPLSRDVVWSLGELLERAMTTCRARLEMRDDE